MKNSNLDIQQLITDQIIASIEKGVGEFKLPWHRSGADMTYPRNISSQIAYKGVNILTLWLTAESKGYRSGLWGTFNQWTALGAKIKKGEKATHVILYKEIALHRDDNDDKKSHLLARAIPVFAAEQVDDYQISNKDSVANIQLYVSHEAEAFIKNTRAMILHGGSEAYYQPSTDRIHLPHKAAFTGTDTSSAEESYYSTLFHELTHFSGAKGRCDRDLTGRFGTNSYAMEELIAELGAAFLCGHFMISSAPRKDHAQYLSSWLSVLKSDKRAIFTAASKASQAVEFLISEASS